ncbi:FAD-dependent monooxygenase [Paracoccus aminophilus]|uniref:6-hydroxynicotinate 3-monooxygenase n=1 Tax=Paracoccus aminophilus JCM 7686 TaxID=1367847 RepID=S5XQK3_PARAH|nr:FAD-dependent monooxygenase [Paracoccus aminophilus]AGT09664.1 6-hydroxynicotinate 3-monooxygenase [Paracoccus aminophilus JCM 7686]
MIGAGIAGLTVATALAQRGARVTVFERAPALGEVGAGIQISPNAGRVLSALGLWDGFAKVSMRSEAVVLRDSAARQIVRMDLARYRPKDDFRFVHRARLLEVFEAGARAAGARIELGAEITDPPAGADLVIAADGVKSAMRPLLNGPETPFFTGQSAWRATIPCAPGAAPVAEVFMGPGRHLVSYPMAGGLRNLVAVVERKAWAEEGWSQSGDPEDLRATFARFGGPVSDWLGAVKEVGLWGLFRHPVAGHWHDARMVLIGDAAHPTLPFIAQGAVMAMEDSYILAACLDADPDQANALARFQALRKPRCTKIVDAANANARNYHLRGPARAVAHAGLRAISRLAPTALIERFAWLYDFDPVASS